MSRRAIDQQPSASWHCGSYTAEDAYTHRPDPTNRANPSILTHVIGLYGKCCQTRSNSRTN